MYQALYRKYRPQTFDDVVGQMAITQTLKAQVSTGKLSHAYLFTGSRGTGKTSSAKILAKAVNCLNPQDGNPCNCCSACRTIDSGACMDVLEIDAASNTGVDNVRDLRDDAIYSPSQVRMRVYIIDEVHMLSQAAFNALLKIVEEPPEHLLFILATTELHKVPATILSRCQRFSFRRLSQEDIASRLHYVAYQEGIELNDSAARVIARLADGGMRDGLSLLDQCASAVNGELTAERVYASLGVAGMQQCGSLMRCIGAHDTKGALTLLNQIYADGKDMSSLMDELACLIRDLLVLKTAPKEGISLLSGVASEEEISDLIKRFSSGELVRALNLVQQTVAGFSRSASRRMDAELCIINMCQPELQMDFEALNARLTCLEDTVRSGVTITAPAPSADGVQTENKHVTEKPSAQEKEQKEETGKKFALENDEDVPIGFWQDIASAARKELGPPVAGFFAPTEAAPVQGILKGNRLILRCANAFTLSVVNKAEVLEIVSRKASAKMGRPISAAAIDISSEITSNAQLEKLLEFGRAHSDIVKIME